MEALDDYRKAGQELYDRLHLPTYPVAIKYIKAISQIPDRIIRPSTNGQKWSLCQAFTYARRWGWSVAMTAEDNFCTPSTASHGWENVSIEDQVEGQIHQKWHKDKDAEKKRTEHQIKMIGVENLERLREFKGFVCSPLSKTVVAPDSVLVYGNGENITHIIHALTFEGEHFPASSFQGFGESCYKGGLVPFITQVPQIVIPGMGDRTFSGSYDYEIAIGLPSRLLFSAVEHLFLSGGRLNMGQPVRTLLPTSITESLTPGFKFIKEKIDESRLGEKNQ
jgi:uncharacterized protein (DUF169 family)